MSNFIVAAGMSFVAVSIEPGSSTAVLGAYTTIALFLDIARYSGK